MRRPQLVTAALRATKRPDQSLKKHAEFRSLAPSRVAFTDDKDSGLRSIHRQDGLRESGLVLSIKTCGLDTVPLVYTIAETGEQMNYAIRKLT